MDDALTDGEIEAILQRQPPERWHDLRDALARLGAEAQPGRWETAPGTLGYVEYAPTVRQAVAAVSALGASAAFDWPAWGGLDRYRAGADLDDAPVAEAVRLVTAIVRADRFNEGALLACVEDGTLARALRRVLAFSDDGRASAAPPAG